MGYKRILSIEGGDGSGKSLLIAKLRAYLFARDVDFMVTREPGGVQISESIREILLDQDNTEMDARTEALLFAAARRQHLVEKVIPAMQEGKFVIFDRYVDSSVVYQGYVRGIGMDAVYDMNLFATQGFLPGLTLVLDVDPEVGRQRIDANNRVEDRLDKETIEFHRKVREGYLFLAMQNPERIRVIDANAAPEIVFSRALEHVERFLEE